MTLFRWFALSLLLHPILLRAQPDADYRGPVRIDLSGLWEFKLDATHQGENERWFSSNATRPEWDHLKVPGAFNELLARNTFVPEVDDKMRFFKGAAWYRTGFPTPASTGAAQRCFLHLSGTVLRHKIWLNGKELGHSETPYLDASYEITSQLAKSGPNTLAIEVDNEIPALGIPDTNWHGWWDDGGLIRPVYLELRPSAFAQTHIATSLNGETSWRLKIHTDVTGATAPSTTVSYTLADSASHIVWHGRSRPVAGNADLAADLSGIQPWSPEHPALYTLTTAVEQGGRSDTTQIRIGFRQIEVRDATIYLNRKPYWIRGVSRHQFLAGAGMSPTEAQDRKDIEDIKALGANFVRLAHYTQSQDVYDACDELGLLVWTEIPAWQSRVESLSDPTVWNESAKPQLTGMVLQHRNHPSVVLWSVANEIPSDLPVGAAYVDKAIAYVKSIDDTRLVTFASDRRVTDKGFQNVDLISINEYYGWYYGKVDDTGPMLDELHRLFPHKPILVSEFGADAVGGWNPASAPAGSRDYSFATQVDFLQSHMSQIFAPERKSFVAGGLIWVYNDFPDPSRIGGDHPPSANFRNNKGLVTMDRIHKPSWAVVKTFFDALATP